MINKSFNNIFKHYCLKDIVGTFINSSVIDHVTEYASGTYINNGDEANIGFTPNLVIARAGNALTVLFNGSWITGDASATTGAGSLYTTSNWETTNNGFKCKVSQSKSFEFIALKYK